MKQWPRIGMVIGLVGIMGLAGCGTSTVFTPTPETLQTRDLKPSDGKALVYFYFEWIFFGGTTEVSLDGMVSPLKKNTYVVWEVAPGTHQMELHYISKFSGDRIPFTIICEPDRSYYVHPIAVDIGDKPQDKIVLADEQTWQKKAPKLQVIQWFKDGAPMMTQKP